MCMGVEGFRLAGGRRKPLARQTLQLVQIWRVCLLEGGMT